MKCQRLLALRKTWWGWWHVYYYNLPPLLECCHDSYVIAKFRNKEEAQSFMESRRVRDHFFAQEDQL